MHTRRAIQIFNGPGAGNIGDELMMHGMWRHIPEDFHLHLILHENAQFQRQPYPARFSLERIELPAVRFELEGAEDSPGLLAGTTLITDVEGWGWPLGFLAPRMRYFRERGLPVDAVGIGADFLVTEEGRRLFKEEFVGVRSWTVRDDAGRDALIDAGVEAARVAVGADWAWLFEPPQDYAVWAEGALAATGIRAGEPLLVVNLFWQGEGESLPIWGDIAATLDRLHSGHGVQILFFCNECRHPGFDRTASEAVQALMTAPSAVMPNLYYAPGEAIAVLRHATVTLGQRYHFCVESVLAGTSPVNLGRSPKIAGLCRELGLTPCGSLQTLDREELFAAVTDAIAERGMRIAALQRTREKLAARALRNLDFFRLWYGYPAA